MATKETTTKAAACFVPSSEMQIEHVGAITVSRSFDDVKKAADISVPLRRPKRSTPTIEAELDYWDAESARKALRDASDLTQYSEFRKEIGMDD